MTKWLGWMIAPALCVGVAQGQGSAKDALNAAEKALHGQPMGLRGYSAERVARFTWDGAKIVPEPTELHALAVFTTRSAKLDKDKIVLTGDWNSIVPGAPFAKVQPLMSVESKIEIKLQGGDPTMVISELKQDLFFADERDQLESIPTWAALSYHVRAKPRVEGAEPPSLPKLPVTAPRLTRSVQPEFSEEGRANKVMGTVRIGFWVSAAGRPTNLWVLRGLNNGFDQNALRAVSQYEFQPATLDGKPIIVELMVDVNFQMF